MPNRTSIPMVCALLACASSLILSDPASARRGGLAAAGSQPGRSGPHPAGEPHPPRVRDHRRRRLRPTHAALGPGVRARTWDRRRRSRHTPTVARDREPCQERRRCRARAVREATEGTAVIGPDGRTALAPPGAPPGRQGRHRGREPDRRQALPLRGRARRVRGLGLRLLGCGVLRAARRRPAAPPARFIGAGELRQQRSRCMDHRVRATAATPTWSSPGCASTPRAAASPGHAGGPLRAAPAAT